jgi:hypothetical protein
MLRSLRVVLVLILSVSLIACTSVQVVQSGEKLKDNSELILVYLKDGRMVKFFSREYALNSTVDSLYISGSGTQTEKNIERSFEGAINFNDVQSIELVEQSLVSKIGVPILFVFAGLFILMIFTTDKPFEYSPGG